jgi:hypothetical protein
MSIKRLNADEKAIYLIGLAVRRQLEQATPDPETLKEIRAVFLWREHWLTPDEVVDITVSTGHLINQELADEFLGTEELSRPARARKPDDIPF